MEGDEAAALTTAALTEEEAPRSVLAARHRSHRFPGRNRSVLARYDEEEYAAIATAAQRAGLTPTGFVAAAALAAARGTTPPVPSLAREALAELMAARTQAKRFATNVNQAAAQLNAKGEVPVWVEQAVAVTARAVARVDAAAALVARRLS